jgi:predicted RecB family nuclease
LLTVSGATPYLKEAVNLPINQKEVYFDIEVDPMHDLVYLHGFVERLHGQAETAKFIPYFAEGMEQVHEEAAFRGAWIYLTSRIQGSTIYYYSPYERTAYKKLAAKYPSVCSVSDVEALFARPVVIDLYSDVVRKSTEWPLYDQSIKTLAQTSWVSVARRALFGRSLHRVVQPMGRIRRPCNQATHTRLQRG